MSYQTVLDTLVGGILIWFAAGVFWSAVNFLVGPLEAPLPTWDPESEPEEPALTYVHPRKL